jgi:chloramphenicol O-acetyltransferase type B
MHGSRSGLKNLRNRIRTLHWTAVVQRQAASAGDLLRVNGRSSVTAATHLGSNVHFNGMTIGGAGRVEIGDNFHSGAGCLILSDNHNYEGVALPYDYTVIAKPVTIERNVWFGERVIVLGGVTVGEGAIIQAGSVVVADIPALGIAGGHPATVFKFRNADHYHSVCESGEFHV